MRLLLILLLGLTLALAFIDRAEAQDLKCADLVKSTEDTVRVSNFRAKPGSIIKMPVFVTNRYDVLSFQLSFQFDTTYMTPLSIAEDTTFKVFLPANRLVRTDTTYDDFDNIISIDTVTRVQAFHLPDQVFPPPTQTVRRPNVISLFMPAEAKDTIIGGEQVTLFLADTIVAGRGIVGFIPFQLKPVAEHGDVINFSVFRTDLITNISIVGGLPDTTFNGCVGCDWVSLVPGVGDVISDVLTFPTIPGTTMQLTIDSTYVETTPPSISSFTAAPSSIASGGSSTLSWTVVNTDSITIKVSTASTRFFQSTQLTGNTTVSPAATTSYLLTAFKGTLTESRSVTVTVGGGGGVGSVPVVSVPSTSYALNEGETVGFAVTATDADAGDQLTLSASNLPIGASFPQQTGGNNISGNFNWTPDIGQKGTYNVTFTARDQNNNTGTRTVTIVVNELQFDRLFSSSAPPPKGKPVGGLRGTTGVLFPINLVSAQTVYGIQFDMDYPASLVRLDSILPTIRMQDYTIYANIGEFPGTVRVVSFGMNNEPVQTDTSTAVLQMAVTIDSSAAAWSSIPMKLKNGRESVDPNPNVGSLPLVTDTTGIIEVDSLGDINTDQSIDVADFVSMVGYIIGSFELTTRQFAAADCVINDTVNVFDLVADINSVYGIPLPIMSAPLLQTAFAAMDYGDLQAGQSDVLTITSEVPDLVAGVEMVIEYDPNTVLLGKPLVTADNAKFSLSYRNDGNGRMKLMLYHLAPGNSSEMIKAGDVDLVSIPMTAKSAVVAGDKKQLRLTRMLMATPAAGRINVEGIDDPLPLPTSFMLKQNYPNPFNPTTLIEFSVGAEAGVMGQRDVTLEIYNIMGQKVRSLVNGKMPVGEHRIEWNATSDNGGRVASGVYLYRLTVGSESQTRKMVFLK